MIRLQKKLLPALTAAMVMLLLQACGQNTPAEGRGESFAAVMEAPDQSDRPAGISGNPVVQEPTGLPQAPVSPPAERAAATAIPAVSSSPAGGAPGAAEVRQQETGAAAEGQSSRPAKATAESITPGTPGPAAAPASAEAAAQVPAGKSGGNVSGTAAALPSSVPVSQPAASASPGVSPVQSAAAAAEIPAASAMEGLTSIDWNGFFDGGDQTRPSEYFWDLSGSKVKIKGFMGEVLSFEKNWFLLIPEPGAECPFDNGDETYWNKIMIVFVPAGDKLRYTSGPLEITGRLDVGIKIDESGYKTMFRLYDASYKSL
ncbi:hypothetical protein [Paenibacillus camerounensis]|uniref:hypothetical protein n=1 Tax=Paenibacillus camerounensis TaxID=1243663 RepID=UPI0006942125|nr:hypothetical protein [Paenibacillus camerounensis]